MQDFLPFHARDAEDAFRTVRLQPTEGSGCSGGVKVTFVAPDNVSVYDNFGCPNEYVLPDINTPLLLAFRIGGSVAGGASLGAQRDIRPLRARVENQGIVECFFTRSRHAQRYTP